jgi:hypothetical protein
VVWWLRWSLKIKRCLAIGIITGVETRCYPQVAMLELGGIMLNDFISVTCPHFLTA